MNTSEGYKIVDLNCLKVLNNPQDPFKSRACSSDYMLRRNTPVISHKRNSSLFLQIPFQCFTWTLLRTNIPNIVKLRLILSGKLLG